jgi:hypothetical protein
MESVVGTICYVSVIFILGAYAGRPLLDWCIEAIKNKFQK